MPVVLNVIETTVELGQTNVEVILESASTPGPAGAPGSTTFAGLTDVTFTGLAVGDRVEYDGTEWVNTASAAVGAHGTSHENGGTDEFSLAGLSGTPTDLQTHLDDTADAHDATAISFTPAGTIAATTVQAAIEEVATEAGGGGAPTDADYLVGTANGSLSGEIVVGTTPGGELGGTWASPTVDATHSGSSHAGVQAAAEATAAAALTTHIADTTAIHGIADTSTLYLAGGTDVAIADGGTGASTAAGARANLDLEAGTDFPALATFNDHSARHEDGGADEISIAGLAGIPTELQTHLDDTTAHLASRIPFTPAGTIAATDVQAAIEEVASEAGGGGGADADDENLILHMEVFA